ncbi:hemoglobin subunit alpha-1-like [Sceloporus undulatus]|uniref:hemoglobin subunit alpha-1-like n=1 Tax=Sceloporus undulatus TaxID=8520 RepID=UPI001C4D9776|nr:hemoglobin subunit alpha-1-like [Sceloporus undulatus]
MTLTEDDKNHIRATWGHISSNAEAFGAEALSRMFAAHPSSKTYFSHFDLTPGSAQIKAHGKKVVDAVTQAVNNLDDMAGALAKLSDLHAEKLRVDPVNFGLLAHCFLVTIAVHNRGPLHASHLLSLDKFFSIIAKILFAHYR